MSDSNVVKVEIPAAVVARHYLGMAAGEMFFAIQHLNKDGRDYYALHVRQRIIGDETHLSFVLQNSGRPVREVVLSLDQIFNQAKMVSDLLTEIRRERNEKGRQA